FESISYNLSRLIAIEDNTVIEFNKFSVRRILKITDKDGNVQDPHTVLGDLGTELADAEYERQKDELGETKLVDMDKQPEGTEDDNPVDDKGDDLNEDNDLYEDDRSEEHTSELQSRFDLVCRLLLENKNITRNRLQCTNR